MVKVNVRGQGAFSSPEGLVKQLECVMNEETRALVDRWIMAFCEAPILIDEALMRQVLDEHDQTEGKPCRTRHSRPVTR